MQLAGTALLGTGMSHFDAWVKTASLKHGPIPALLPSLKHVELARAQGWMDRISEATALIQCGASTPEDAANASGHTKFLESLKAREAQLAATSSVKKQAGGFITCKCKSQDVDVDQRQTRSSDEPMTMYALCRTCGASWVVRDGTGVGGIGLD